MVNEKVANDTNDNKGESAPSESTLLSQWQTCVEMANSVSQRRDSMNNIFITLNLAIVAAVSFTWSIKSIFLLIAGLVISIIWCQFIHNYKLLNEAKFKVINELEKKLQSAPFADEWKVLQGDKQYKDGTKLETGLAIMFAVLYGVAIIILLGMRFVAVLGYHC